MTKEAKYGKQLRRSLRGGAGRLQYFLSLPPDMQDAISLRSEEIRSVDDLQQYVELLQNG